MKHHVFAARIPTNQQNSIQLTYIACTGAAVHCRFSRLSNTRVAYVTLAHVCAVRRRGRDALCRHYRARRAHHARETPTRGSSPVGYRRGRVSRSWS